MNDITVVIVLLALMNKNGFNSIKSAIQAVENISSGFENIQKIASFLPNMQNMMSAFSQSETKPEYIDTLKDIINNISQK